MDFLRFVLAVLAVFRVSRLFALDEGPLNIFGNLRITAGKKANYSKSWKFIADLINCPYCSGIWFSILAVPLVMKKSRITDLILISLGISGGQDLIQTISNFSERQ